jgi:hypothetical protein
MLGMFLLPLSVQIYYIQQDFQVIREVPDTMARMGWSVGVIVTVVVLSSLFSLVISLLSRRKGYIYGTYVP